MRLNLGTETPEAYRFMGSKGILDVGEFAITLTPQSGKDESPSYYTSSYPHALREDVGLLEVFSCHPHGGKTKK